MSLDEALLDLQRLTERLRRDCPWDREQTAQTIVPHTVEEAYEVADAALAGRPEKLLDELGDLLFQVYFLSLLLQERGRGDLEQVARVVHDKLVRRHPHVFGDAEAQTAGRVRERWEQIKSEQEGREGVFHHVPENLPALLHARKVQRRAAAVGFEYPDVAGALADGSTRTVLWLAALAIDYAGPLVTFWVPALPRVGMGAWEVGSEHFAERFQLFIILALGESVVITGATTADLELTTARVVAFGCAFLATAALWWLYFSLVATITQRRLALAENRTVLARDAFTYLHVLIVAGILLSAVGDELVIAHPTEELAVPRPRSRPGDRRDLLRLRSRGTARPSCRRSLAGWPQPAA